VFIIKINTIKKKPSILHWDNRKDTSRVSQELTKNKTHCRNKHLKVLTDLKDIPLKESTCRDPTEK
jgi:hypothetical protein